MSDLGDPTLAAAQARYRYMPRNKNHIAPMAMAESWPWLAEQYGPSWLLPFVPPFLKSQARHFFQRIRTAFEYATFRYDKLNSYDQLFGGSPPAFAQRFKTSKDPKTSGDPKHDDHDAIFAWWRVAGANAELLRREPDLAALLERIPLRSERIARALKGPIALDGEARSGRLFTVDFRMLLNAIRSQRKKEGAVRDSRWGEKYLPTPIGVFLAAPDKPGGLVPLAIQIDGEASGEHNPVYYPDDGWGWRIAKAYFEAADVTFQAGFGHIFSTHLMMEPFSMATPRQLPPLHPVRVLLQPHTRFTLTTNQAGYKVLVDRSKIYGETYTATLEQLRHLIVHSYNKHGFVDLQLETDLARRGVEHAPLVYPYRDDMRLWLQPIGEFVGAYVQAVYADDAAVQGDAALQAWKQELEDPERGAVRNLLPAGEALDTRERLAALLAQVLFIAGPRHASQHYSANYYYRYTPEFPGGVYLPPPQKKDSDSVNFARWLAMLPSISRAADQFRSNTYTCFHYDRFGDYDRFPLGRLPEAREPIARLRQALDGVQSTIEGRQAARLFPYEFALPSRVPNSINI
jgi:arachidonate 15-lipoxygenase